MRASLGASRGRLVRQNLVESGLLSLAGGALGLVAAYGGLDLLKALAGRSFACCSTRNCLRGVVSADG